MEWQGKHERENMRDSQERQEAPLQRQELQLHLPAATPPLPSGPWDLVFPELQLLRPLQLLEWWFSTLFIRIRSGAFVTPCT